MGADCLIFADPQPYLPMAEFQARLVAARAVDAIGDIVLLLQHKPVITLGRRGRTRYLLRTGEELANSGIDYCRASRGGDVTYHAPGQWVIYPIMRLGGVEADAHGYLWNLEELSLLTAAEFGVVGFRRPGMNGAWSTMGKFAAIGFHLSRWITSHGMSLNVNLDLDGFRAIVPCGLEGESVTSLAVLRSDHPPNLVAVGRALLDHFPRVFQRSVRIDPALALVRYAEYGLPPSVRLLAGL